MENLLAYVVIGAVMLAGVGLFCEANAAVHTWLCAKTARKMAMEYSWEYATGCMVKAGGQWVSLGSFRTIGGVE